MDCLFEYVHDNHVAFYMKKIPQYQDLVSSENVVMPDGSRPYGMVRCGTCGKAALPVSANVRPIWEDCSP